MKSKILKSVLFYINRNRNDLAIEVLQANLKILGLTPNMINDNKSNLRAFTNNLINEV